MYNIEEKSKGRQWMARHTKVIKQHNIDRREVGYYYTPDFIASYLIKRLLMIQPTGEKALDPCVGQEELIRDLLKTGKKINGMDVHAYKSSYDCDFQQKDFIAYYKENKGKTLEYDYFIANPPYNCHEVNYIRDHKSTLQNLFHDVGVHNMYSMFISAMIDLAKEGALIGLVTYDSFFTAKAHTKLRNKILQTCTIHEITMCPTDLFHEQAADVRTSIIILQKGKRSPKQDVYIRNRPFSTPLFQEQLAEQLDQLKVGNAPTSPLDDIILSSKKDNNEFIIECPREIRKLFSHERLGDVFTCVTGISTGNDRLYLSKEKQGKYTIPFYKNPGTNRFYTDNFLYLHEDFLTFDQEVSNFIVRNKALLYQPGITCSSMGVQFTACRLPANATYGVNANIICNDDDAWWLLAYLNSELVAYFVRSVLNRSNMITSGYVARIPLLPWSRQGKDSLDQLAKEIYNHVKLGAEYAELLDSINNIVFQEAQLSQATINIVQQFNKHIIQHT